MTTKPVVFGSKNSSGFRQWLVDLCHDNEGRILSRLAAPLVRKLIVKQTSKLPMDITVNGINFRCQLTDNYSEKKFVFSPWRYDREERRILSDALANGGTFLDIGANIGIYTLTAMAAMGTQKGTILAFEPNPVTLSRLKFNVEANPQFNPENVTILDHGIADRETSFFLQHKEQNLGESSISGGNSEGESGETDGRTRIQCRPLLAVLSERGIDAIDALKIDIEGAEDLALSPFLHDAPDSLLPRLLIIENSESKWKTDLFQLVRSRGYTLADRNKMNSIFSLETGSRT